MTIPEATMQLAQATEREEEKRRRRG